MFKNHENLENQKMPNSDILPGVPENQNLDSAELCPILLILSLSTAAAVVAASSSSCRTTPTRDGGMKDVAESDERTNYKPSGHRCCRQPSCFIAIIIIHQIMFCG